jgi:hypothetical protein
MASGSLATNKPHKTIILTLYLYRRCRRAQQEGVIRLNDFPNQNKQVHFNYLDEIPRKIRQHLKTVGLTYEVDKNTDDTVITAKKRMRKVVRKVRA